MKSAEKDTATWHNEQDEHAHNYAKDYDNDSQNTQHPTDTP
jgi:hypothetical protein